MNNTGKVFVRSFGCSSNTADSEVIRGCLTQAGYLLVGSEDDADVIIYNSCAVKGPTENRIVDALKKIPKVKKVIVAGCLPLISYERLLREVRFDAATGPSPGKNIVELVERVLRNERIVEVNNSSLSMPNLDLPKIFSNPVISVVPVNYGCLGSCAYCCVVHARGKLRSYPPRDVIERVKTDLSVGAKEFWVTSQDVACYGREIGTNIAELLKELSALSGDFRIRVGMMTPNFVLPFLGDLVEAFRSEKVFKFLHLPVQSGDDEVLRRMRRFYTAKEFIETVSVFRKAFPQLTLSTDVIVGFPGETKEAFENTLDLISQVKPDVVNVSKFFARPKTAAWDMRDIAVEKKEIKRRSAETANLVKQVTLEQNLRWVGWEGEILIDEKGKVESSWVGRNFAYKPVAIKTGDANLLGKRIKVKIVRALSTHLVGVSE